MSWGNQKRWTEKNATSLFNAGFEGRRDCDRGVQAVSREDMAGGEAESVRRGRGRDGDLSSGNPAVHDYGRGRFVFAVRQGGQGSGECKGAGVGDNYARISTTVTRGAP